MKCSCTRLQHYPILYFGVYCSLYYVMNTTEYIAAVVFFFLNSSEQPMHDLD